MKKKPIVADELKTRAVRMMFDFTRRVVDIHRYVPSAIACFDATAKLPPSDHVIAFIAFASAVRVSCPTALVPRAAVGRHNRHRSRRLNRNNINRFRLNQNYRSGFDNNRLSLDWSNLDNFRRWFYHNRLTRANYRYRFSVFHLLKKGKRRKPPAQLIESNQQSQNYNQKNDT